MGSGLNIVFTAARQLRRWQQLSVVRSGAVPWYANRWCGGLLPQSTEASGWKSVGLTSEESGTARRAR